MPEPIGVAAVAALVERLYAEQMRDHARPLVFELLGPPRPTFEARIADAGVVPCAWVPD